VLVLVTEPGREREVGPQFPFVLEIERGVSLFQIRLGITARDRKLRRAATKRANRRWSQTRTRKRECASITLKTAKVDDLRQTVWTIHDLIVLIEPWTKPAGKRVSATEILRRNTVEPRMSQPCADFQKVIARSP